MTSPTWPKLRVTIEAMVEYPAGDGWHVCREAADKALDWICWAEAHQPTPVPKLLSDDDEDLSLVWRTVDGWAIRRTFPKDAEPYWLAMPSRDPEALAASPEVAALIAEARREGWNEAIEAGAALAHPPQWERKGKPGLWRLRRAKIAATIRALKETTHD